MLLGPAQTMTRHIPAAVTSATQALQLYR